MNGGLIGGTADEAAHCIDFANEMAFSHAADGWVA